MELRKLQINQIDEIKTLFKNVFMNEPWNDDWSNEEQLDEYMLDLSGNRNSLAIGLYDAEELVFLQTERELPAYSFYQKVGFKELEGHASLVKRFD